MNNANFIKIFKNPNESFDWESTNDTFDKKYDNKNIGVIDTGDKKVTIHTYKIKDNIKSTIEPFKPIILKWKNTNESAYEGGWDTGILSNGSENNYQIGIHGDDCIVRFAHMISNSGSGEYTNAFVIDMNMTENTLNTIYGTISTSNIIELK